MSLVTLTRSRTNENAWQEWESTAPVIPSPGGPSGGGNVSPFDIYDPAKMILQGGIALSDFARLHGMPFATREAAEAAFVPLAVSRLVIAAGTQFLQYERDTNGTALVTADGHAWSPQDVVTPEHWGCVGDWDGLSGTDDTVAMLAMVAWFNLYGAHQIFLSGKYLVNAPLVFTRFGVEFQTPGVAVAHLIGGHLAGPVIQFRKSYANFTGVKVLATPARQAEPYDVMNAGVIVGDFDWQDPENDNGASAAWCIIEQNSIEGHPGPGVLQIGSGGRTSHNNIAHCKGHGVDVSTGNRFNVPSGELGFPGWAEVRHNKINYCGGHAVCLGSPDSSAGDTIYRYRVENNDCGYNATDPAVRYTEHQYYLVGEQIRAILNVAAGATPGVFVAGRQHSHHNWRFIGLGGEAFEIGSLAGYTTLGVEISEFRVNGPVSILNPAIKIASALNSSNGVRIQQTSKVNISKLVADADRYRFAELKYGGDAEFGGTLSVQGSPVLLQNPVREFTPFFVFSGMGDAVFSHTTQEGRVTPISDGLIYVYIRVVATVAQTTASGVLLVKGLDSLGYGFNSGFRQALTLSASQNLQFDGGSQLMCYTNGTDTFRVVQVVNGSTAMESLGPDDIAVGPNILFAASGVLEVTSGV